MKSELGRGLSIERATQLARLARATLLISALADFESQDVWGTRLGLSEDGSVVVGACGWLVGIKRSLGALLLTASPLRDSKAALFMQDLVLLPFSQRVGAARHYVCQPAQCAPPFRQSLPLILPGVSAPTRPLRFKGY